MNFSPPSNLQHLFLFSSSNEVSADTIVLNIHNLHLHS
jgi:hypothetical protein